MAIDITEWTVVRWARTAAGVFVTDTNEAVEPPSGAKDTGFVGSASGGTPGVDPAYMWRQWFNWWLQQIGAGLEYFRDLNDARDQSQVLRSQKVAGTAFGTPTGSGTGSTTVEGGLVEVNGRLYEVPQTVVTIGVQSSLAVMLSYIVVRVTGGVASIVLSNGTVSSQAPPVAENEVVLHQVQRTTGSSTFLITDLRRFGRAELDELMVSEAVTFDGPTAATPHLSIGGGSMIIAGDTSDVPAITVSSLATSISASRWIHPTGDEGLQLLPYNGAEGIPLDTGSNTVTNDFEAQMATSGVLRFPIHILPKSAEFSQIQVFVLHGGTSSVQVRLIQLAALNSNTPTVVATATSSSSSGAETIKLTSIGHSISSQGRYFVEVTATAGTPVVRSVAVEIQRNTPFHQHTALP